MRALPAQRHFRVLGLPFFLLAALLLPRGEALAAANAPAAAIDAPTKRLMAAHGFFQRGLFKLAADEFADFLKTYPNHAQATSARHGLAVCRYQLKEYAAAATLLLQVLRDPKFTQRDEALAVLGTCQLATEANDKALASFDELLSKYRASKHVELAAVNRAKALHALGKIKDSLAACEAFLKKHPKSTYAATCRYQLGLSQQGLGKCAEAADSFQKLLKDYPNSPYRLNATLLLGQCMEGQDKLDPAAQQFRNFIKSAPADRQAEGQYSLGVVLYKAGKYPQAVKELSLVLSKHAKSPYAQAARLQLGLAELAGGEVNKARKTLTEVAAKDPTRANKARYWLAQCDMREKKYAEARRTLDALAKLKPRPANLPEVLFARAVCTMSLGKHAEAAKEFTALRKGHPKCEDYAEATYHHAFCLHKLGQHKESLALCTTTGQTKDVAGRMAALRAENLFLMGKYAEAAKAFTELDKTAKDPSTKVLHAFRLGQCAYFTDDYAKAIELLGKVVSSQQTAKDKRLREAIFLMGDAQLRTDQHAAAAKTLSQYLAPGAAERKEEATFKLALAQLRSGQAAPAEKTLAGLMKGPRDSPWVAKAMLEYGKLAYKQKQPGKAAPVLAKLAAPPTPEELAAPAISLLGSIDFDARKYDQAAAHFGRIVQKFPKHPLAIDAAFQQAVCLQQAGKTKQALELFRKYLKAHPADKRAPEARHLVGSCLAKLDNHAEAVKVFTALAADKKTRNEAVLYELAWSQREVKDAKGAAKTYRQLLTGFPKGKLVAAARAELADLLYDDGKFKAACELLAKVLADKATDADARRVPHYRLGWCYAKLNDHAKAGAVFADFAREYAKDELAPWALYQAGVAYATAGNHAQAEQHFATLVKAHPKHESVPVAYLKLGEVQNEARRYQPAATTFQTFLTKYPKNEFVYLGQFGMGWSLESRRKYIEARKWYGKVVETHNGITAARAQFQIGETHFAEGKFERAAQELLKVDIVYAYPEWSARALYEAGRAFEQLKQLDNARQQYALCVKKYKDLSAAKLAQQRLKAIGEAKP